MNRPGGEVALHITVDPTSSLSESARAKLGQALKRDLRKLPNARVEAVADYTAIDSAKAAGEALTLGALVLAIAPNIVEQALIAIREWVQRPGAIPVKIQFQKGTKKISVQFDASVASSDEIKKLAREILN